ncbi:hypothetical protein F0562_020465 [Nyssa sinensis]|uniref:Dirigent protein n=1 Tax=Nyssa sinensis TaxID=561372 RepID=A0A5J5BTZ7_9ASTE|nr:hypothetical protein F0562_020465 [Nyssa sinensis]
MSLVVIGGGALVMKLEAVPIVHGIAEGPKEVEEWFKKMSHAKQKVTKLHFYFHNLLGGKNPTAATVARANITSPTFFGLLNMMDYPLTVEPALSSTLVGRAQGLYGTASLEEICDLMAMNFVFKEGEYNGSSLAVLGHNPIMNQYRELAVVGGSGVFRLARGVVTLNTYFFNPSAGNATVEVNVIVSHY